MIKILWCEEIRESKQKLFTIHEESLLIKQYAPYLLIQKIK